jgi:transposase
MARTGAQWRQLPDEFGKWNSVFRRYRRWVETGVFEAMLETLADMVDRAAASPPSSMPGAMRKAARSASS